MAGSGWYDGVYCRPLTTDEMGLEMALRVARANLDIARGLTCMPLKEKRALIEERSRHLDDLLDSLTSRENSDDLSP